MAKPDRGGFAVTIVSKMGKGKGKASPPYGQDPPYDESGTGRTPEGESEDAGMGEEDDKMAQESAAGDLMTAMKSGDKGKMVEAFKALKDLCY